MDSGKDAWGGLREALRFHDSGQYKLAEKHYIQYLAAYPDDADAIANYAACLYCMAYLRKSRKFAMRALSVDPEHLHGLKILALVEAADHHTRQALAICDTIVRLAPESSDSFRAKSEIQSVLGLAARAEESLHSALKLSPDDDSLHRALGNIALTLGKCDLAEESARRALALDPENKESLALLGRIQIYRGQRGKSIATLISSMRIDPNDLDNRTMLLNACRSVFPPYRWIINGITRSASVIAKASVIFGMVLTLFLRVFFTEFTKLHGGYQAIIMGGNFVIGPGSVLVLPQVIDAFLLRSPSYALYFSPAQRLATRLIAGSIVVALLLPLVFHAWTLAPLGRWIILLFGTTVGSFFNCISRRKRAALVASCLSIATGIIALVVTLAGGQAVGN